MFANLLITRILDFVDTHLLYEVLVILIASLTVFDVVVVKPAVEHDAITYLGEVIFAWLIFYYYCHCNPFFDRTSIVYNIAHVVK